MKGVDLVRAEACAGGEAHRCLLPVRERTGLPIIRAQWLHYPNDHAAVARSDEYLWGRDMLVAPVVEKGATVRRLYLPRGTWYDFWTEERVEGGREIERPVDLATMPIYVRAGAVLPMSPVRQYTDEPVNGPLTLTVFPGADGTSSVYEDDGRTFAHRKGEWMSLPMAWQESGRRLDLRLGPGSRMLPSASRTLEIRLAGTTASREVAFTGSPLRVQL